jgi:magnesium transporter
MADEAVLDRIKRAVDADGGDLTQLVEDIGPAAVAEVLPRLSEPQAWALLQSMKEDEIRDVLGLLDPAEAAAIVRGLDRHEAADVLEAMRPDDATDVIEELPRGEAERILVQMEPDDAAEIRGLMSYPEDSAGSLMTPAFVAIAPDLTTGEALSALGQLAGEAETIYYVYVIDAQERLLGVLSLRELVLSRRDEPVTSAMIPNPVKVLDTADQETAARLLIDNRLLALPVVDAGDHLLGIITQDDIAEVLEDEATEDIERLGGSQPLDTPYRLAGVPLLVRRRVIWLLILFVAEAYTGTVLRAFGDEISRVVALSYFIPLLIGTGGNVGSQVTTTLVRAMAVNEVRLRDVGWVLVKEMSVGVILGLVMAFVAFGRAQLLSVGLRVGFVVSLAILLITIWSATVASVLPLVLRRLGIDPAVVSAPFISTLVDGTGLVIYFMTARIVLGLS